MSVWEGPGDGPGECPGDGPGESPEESPGEGPGESPEEGPGEDPEEGPGGGSRREKRDVPATESDRNAIVRPGKNPLSFAYLGK